MPALDYVWGVVMGPLSLSVLEDLREAAIVNSEARGMEVTSAIIVALIDEICRLRGWKTEKGSDCDGT